MATGAIAAWNLRVQRYSRRRSWRGKCALAESDMEIVATPVFPGLLGYGENDSLAYMATGSNCLDLFFTAVPGVPLEQLESLLTAAWQESPLVALKIVFQFGDPRQGKGDLLNFHRAMMWLYTHHYDTFMLNLEHVPTFSYYGSLLNLLQYAGEPGLLEEKVSQVQDHRTRKILIRSSLKSARRRARRASREKQVEEFLSTQPAAARLERREANSKFFNKIGVRVWASAAARDAYIEFVRTRDQAAKESARKLRHERRSAMAEAARRRLENDRQYKALYARVAGIFAEALAAELQAVQRGESIGGLPGKWAPTPGLSHDKRTRIVDGIVERLYPAAAYKLEDGTYEEYLSFMRDKYRKLLSHLRGAAEVPEHFVGGSTWHSVNYARMASRCRLVHGHVFAKHDGERYQAYLEEVRSGVRRAPAAGAVLPHELVQKAQADEGDISEASLQWLRLVSDVKEKGRLPSAMAICDVSGSMSGEPMDVAIALSLLLSDVAEEPWKNKICTFSESPEFVTVPPATGDNLKQRAHKVAGMDWGWNTDLEKVFDELLATAKFFNLGKDKLPQMLFIFSDMEFDQAGKGAWTTELDSIRSKYSAAGYDVPQICFWNLRASRSMPSNFSEPGVVMMSGFSAGLMKSFLEFRPEAFEPQAQMLAALAPYEVLQLATARTL